MTRLPSRTHAVASTLQRPPLTGTSEATDLNLFAQLRPFPQATSPDFEASWRDLERRSLLRNPFLSPSFLLPQWDLEAPNSVQLLTIQDQMGRWLFAGLFKRVRGTRNLPLPHLVALRTEHSFKTGVLVDASECEEVIAALWQFLRKQNLHGISFPIFPVRSSLACLLRERCEEDRTAAFVSGVIERATTSLAGMDDQGMSSKRAKSLRRGRRALEKQGALEFRIRDQSGVDDFLHLESLGWKGHAGSALACDPRQTEAFRRVIAGFGRQERVRFAEMVLSDRVIASMCLFRSESDYYAFKIGWDPQLERGCPGFLLASEIQSHLPDLPGCERIDGCACPGSFLDHVWSGRKEIGDATFTTTLWGAAAARGTEMVRNLVRRMRGTKTVPIVPEAAHTNEEEFGEAHV